MKIEVDSSLIDHLVSLARLDICQEEREILLGQISQILEYMARIGENVNSAEDGDSRGESDSIRDDTVACSLPREILLGEAPSSDGAYFQVPRIKGPKGGR